MIDFFKEKNGYIILFLFLFVLCYCFPYTHDDWGWGSSAGLELLSTGFADYNGRYFSNLLVIILTRCPFLKIMVMTVTLFLIFILIHKIVNKENKTIPIIAFILFFTINSWILSQGLVWTSGFVNYTISMFFILIYLYCNRNLFENKNLTFTKKSIIPLFLLGIITSLVLESITIYNFILAILIIVWTLKKEKKLIPSQIAYFIGSLIGTILMFSNGAYHHILSGSDSYRTVGDEGFITSALNNYVDVIYNNLIFSNVILVLAIFILIILIAFRYYKKHSKFNLLDYITLFILSGYSIYVLLNKIFTSWNIIGDYTKYFEAFITTLYLIFLVVFVFTFITNKCKRNKCLFILFSIFIICATLLIVSPVGYRNFLTTSILFIILIGEMYDYLKIKETPLKIFLIFGAITVGVYILSIYSYVKLSDISRTNYINSQIKDSNEIIYFPKLPYENYVWISEPILNKLNGEVQEFYGMDKNTEIVVIQYNERR